MGVAYDTVIIGAGIAGLTVGFDLQRRGRNVLVLEKQPSAGGVMRTVHRDGYLVELGPNTLLDTKPGVRTLLDQLGLADRRVFASSAARNRFIVRDGVPVPLPRTPAQFLRTPLLGWRSKFRLLGEPFLPAWDNRREESIADFVRRRLGREVLDYGVNPFVAGVYAGRPEALSVRHAFPRLYDIEQQHGSLLKGQWRTARERKRRGEPRPPRPRLYSFQDGMSELPQALARRLGPALQLETTVGALAPDGSHWRVACTDARGKATSLTAETVVYAGRLTDLAALDFQPARAAILRMCSRVDYPPVAVLGLGFRLEDVGHPLDGFGLLVPEIEQRSLLGALFSSSLFPGRAPAGHALLTVFIGGARQPDHALLPHQDLFPLIRDDLRALLDIRAEPVFVHVHTWPASIPQYTIGYDRVKDSLDRLEQDQKGFFFAGNYRDGPSVPDTMASSLSLAARIAGVPPEAPVA